MSQLSAARTNHAQTPSQTETKSQFDTGLQSLALAFSLTGTAFDVDRARREYLRAGARAELNDLIRIARAEGYKARKGASSVARLDALSLPLIAERKDGSFFVIGRKNATSVLVGKAGGPPQEWSREKLGEEWSGAVLFVPGQT
jgi:subfamily B ATP-binding cassette protein HlyB/CyaB